MVRKSYVRQLRLCSFSQARIRGHFIIQSRTKTPLASEAYPEQGGARIHLALFADDNCSELTWIVLRNPPPTVWEQLMTSDSVFIQCVLFVVCRVEEQNNEISNLQVEIRVSYEG